MPNNSKRPPLLPQEGWIRGAWLESFRRLRHGPGPAGDGYQPQGAQERPDFDRAFIEQMARWYRQWFPFPAA